MNASTSRRIAALLAPLAAALVLVGAKSPSPAPGRPDQFVILSTTDVKGKTSPCGCHIPKGGLSRQMSFLDSTRADYAQVLWVDNGGFFPDEDSREDVARFLIEAMQRLGVDAVGLGERELRFGSAYLTLHVRRTNLPMVCANLFDRGANKPLVAPYLVKTVGAVKVGVFGLISDHADLGPAHDSLVVRDPLATARQTVAELRRKGADVVVLLSQLGKADAEDLVSACDGIDALIVGHDVPILEHGRMIKNTVACYGGEQGQYMCRTILTLDPKRHVTLGEAAAVMLSPEVGDNAAVSRVVKSFEDGYNERMRREQAQRAVQAESTTTTVAAEHYLGGELCVRCHAKEAEQWKTTAHSIAWSSLVEAKKDATPECVPCHVVGNQQPGGFVSGAATPRLVNVQCENCHGMGTLHGSGSGKTASVTEETCTKCHNRDRDPEFDFARKLPMIVHANTSGESMRSLQSKMGGASGMMKGSGH